MKVIRISNFNHDYDPSRQITLSASQEKAEAIAKLLNEMAGEGSEDYYKVVDDNHTLNYADLDTANGYTKTFEAFVTQRGYLALPLRAQITLYNEYMGCEAVAQSFP